MGAIYYVSPEGQGHKGSQRGTTKWSSLIYHGKKMASHKQEELGPITA